MNGQNSDGRIIFPDVESHVLSHGRPSEESDLSAEKIVNISSDSQSIKIENLEANTSKDQEYSLSYLESSFSSMSGEKVGLNRNFAEKHGMKKRSDRAFMTKVMIFFIIFDIVFIAYLVRLAFSTNIGFITKVSSLK